MADNAFVRIADWSARRHWPTRSQPDQLHRTLDRYAAQCCPVLDVFGQRYHWSLMQVEYSTDLIVPLRGHARPLYEQLVAPGGAAR